MPDERKGIKSVAVLSVLLGIWLFGSSLAFGPGEALTINGAAAGVLIALLGVARAIFQGTSSLSWINAALGAWIVLSPWVLGGLTHDARTWNYFFVGVVVTSVAMLSLTVGGVRRHSGTTTRIS